VLITGATGFVGRHLVAACQGADEEVVAYGRTGDGHLDGVAELVTGDLRDLEANRGLLARTRPAVVYHLAALASVGRSWDDPGATLRDNVALTLNVLELVRHESPETVVVLTNSGEAYGPPQFLPVTEEHPLRPQNPYAVSKASCDLLAAMYADAHGLRIVRARAFNHAGPGQGSTYAIASFTQQAARALDRGEREVVLRTGNLDTRRDFTDVRDVVRAYRLLAAHGEQGDFNICSGTAVSLREIVGLIERAAGVPVRAEQDPARVRAHEVPEVRGSHDRLSAATGWEPEIPLERTVADALAAWRCAT
jgi:GDP-4-dehydro-6-deoxy-D-mannose reductase